jgi:hypothetical protein
MFRRGASLADLAEQFHITPQRVGQVVAAFHPEGEEDSDRALFRGCLWRLYDEVEGMIAEPGYKLRPDGRPAETPDGDPALDMNARIQAGELQLKVIKELRLLDARDKTQPRQLHVEFSVAQQAMMRDIEERRRQMLQGEVVRELPPPPPQPPSP